MFSANKLFTATFATAALALAVGSVSANSILLAYNGTTPASGGETSWNYTANLAGTAGIPPQPSMLKTGDKFVIADFTGLDQAKTTLAFATATSALGGGIANFSLSYESTSSFAVGSINPVYDTAGKTNVVITYIGAANQMSDIPHLVDFSVISTVPSSQGGSLGYGANDHNADGSQPQTNFGLVTGPVSVPLPASAWGGMGLMGLLGGVKALRRRSMAR